MTKRVFTTLQRLIRLQEADNMPEVDFSSGPMDDAPIDDFSAPMDDFSAPVEPEAAPDLPSIPLTDINAAVLSLLSKNSDSTRSAKDLIDYHSNARVAIKHLIQHGVVTVANGNYTVSEMGRHLMVSYGLIGSPDEGAELTPAGNAAWRRYFS